MLWLGLPFTLLTGFFIATSRAGNIIARPIAQLVSPFEVELQNRYLLHQALWGHYFYRRPESIGAGGGAGGNAALAALLVQDAVGSGDMLARAEALREAVPAELIARVLSSFRAAIVRFPDSAIAHIFLARFFQEWLANKHSAFFAPRCARRAAATIPPPPPSDAFAPFPS